ncbi:palmitoyltransferase [Tilletia horrida]|uniref:Palmitoyltransferase n=1 Tax=Tilletia horrida TaxID=155126 RepID=A0AAN6GW57_9BASI|nr:palmitoyltransferase [Tilletia horrida]KAK0552493.1 palmitoyltransferase [Tilletia horrida]KAK0561779.1 palmitoyltransferase [Tilletia horrida]
MAAPTFAHFDPTFTSGKSVNGLLIFANPPGASAVPLIGAWELGSFNFLQRGTVQDVIMFMSKTVAERTQPTQRQSVQENSYVAHVHARPASDGVVGVLVSDTEYPVRVAFSLLNKALDEFLLKVPKAQWSSQINAITTGSQAAPSGKSTLLVGDSVFPQASDYVKRYQDPRQADTIMKVQQELDETKIVLHKTIDSVLKRGEDLDNLVAKSQSLSSSSKQFYKTAKKQNSCCTII